MSVCPSTMASRTAMAVPPSGAGRRFQRECVAESCHACDQGEIVCMTPGLLRLTSGSSPGDAHVNAHHHLFPTIRLDPKKPPTEPWLSILRTRSAACAITCASLSRHHVVDRSSLSNRRRAPTRMGEFCSASAGSWCRDRRLRQQDQRVRRPWICCRNAR